MAIPKLILGSGSPRRKSILEFFRIPFTCISSDFNERAVAYRGDPVTYTTELSLGKAKSIQNLCGAEPLILTADTVVVYNNQIFNKPASHQEAIEMLKILRGQTHSVITSLTLMQGDQIATDVEKTEVTFSFIPDIYLSRYIDTFSTLDKCGSYTVHEGGSLIVQHVQGCIYNVQGLPIKTLQRLLLEFNIDLWDYLV